MKSTNQLIIECRDSIKDFELKIKLYELESDIMKNRLRYNNFDNRRIVASLNHKLNQLLKERLK